MTPQEVFDTSIRKIIDQGGPAVNTAVGGCRYRTKDRACAVGVLLTDEEYTLDMEGEAAYELVSVYNIQRLIPHRPLLTELQMAHDGYLTTGYTRPEPVWQKWKGKLEEIAHEFDLNTDALEEIPNE